MGVRPSSSILAHLTCSNSNRGGEVVNFERGTQKCVQTFVAGFFADYDLTVNIIPTSCSQGTPTSFVANVHLGLIFCVSACTSVVTEISYHDEATIVGEVDFLTETEWKGEISVLLSDLVGDDGVATRRPVDTKSPPGIAWHKARSRLFPDTFRKLT